MIVQTARRPLGCWKSVMRQNRQQRELLVRLMATETTPTPTPTPESTATPVPPPRPSAALPKPKFHKIKSNNPQRPIRTAFAVYPTVPSARKTTPEPLASYHARQIARLDPTGARTALFDKSNRDAAKPGDVLQVTAAKGIEPFAGVCLSIRRAGVDTAILLRNQLTKVGVEMWYKIYSPSVAGIEIVWRRPKRARRARLFYMRKPKHDMRSVDHLVESWRRARNVFSSKARKGAKGAKKG